MLIYDIEILNAIPDRSGQRQEGVEYCEGWHDYAGMSIACVGAYDYKHDRSRVFLADNLQEFGWWAVTQECVVGFNNNRFDNRLLEAQGIAIQPEKSYDLLQEIWRAAGIERRLPRSFTIISTDQLCTLSKADDMSLAL